MALPLSLYDFIGEVPPHQFLRAPDQQEMEDVVLGPVQTSDDDFTLLEETSLSQYSYAECVARPPPTSSEEHGDYALILDEIQSPAITLVTSP